MAAVAPLIWTPANFKSQTGGNATRKALAEIDTLLGEWDGMQNGLQITNKVNKLKQLVDAGTRYIALKEGKNARQAAAIFGRPSDRLVNRIAKAKVLLGQIFLRLAFEQHARQKLVRAGAPHSALLAARGNLRDLQGSYAHERTNFDATKAGSHLAGTQTEINPQGASYVHQKIDENAGRADLMAALPGPIRQIIVRGFDNLTLAEFNQLQAHFSGGQQGLGHLPLVHFARKDERLREMMLIPMNGKLYRTDGQPAGVGGGGHRGYALDMYGNVIVARANSAWAGNTAQMNHSTLCAGRAVICAGELRLVAGEITEISNASGHYLPTTANLAQALWVLKDEYDIDVTAIQTVTDITTGNIYSTPGHIIGFMAPFTPV